MLKKRLAEIGEKIKQRRKDLRLSQEDLAKLSNLSANYVCLLENGERIPSIRALEKISHALKITPGELFIENNSRRGLPQPLVSTQVLDKIEEAIQLLKAVNANLIRPHGNIEGKKTIKEETLVCS